MEASPRCRWGSSLFFEEVEVDSDADLEDGVADLDASAIAALFQAPPRGAHDDEAEDVDVALAEKAPARERRAPRASARRSVDEGRGGIGSNEVIETARNEALSRFFFRVRRDRSIERDAR